MLGRPTACLNMSSVPTPVGFQTKEREWSKRAKERFFGAKNDEAMLKWADGQGALYKDNDEEKGKALHEKYPCGKELEACITETYKTNVMQQS